MKKISLIIFTLFIIGILFYLFSRYTTEINLNWNINIPIEDELIYYKDNLEDGNVNFLGDKLSYAVLKYKNPKKINKLTSINWIFNKNEKLEKKILDVIDKIEVDDKYKIDFTKNYQYFYKEDRSNEFVVNYIIMLYYKENNIIYIVEFLM